LNDPIIIPMGYQSLNTNTIFKNCNNLILNLLKTLYSTNNQQDKKWLLIDYLITYPYT
jgi:hypothetical protein